MSIERDYILRIIRRLALVVAHLVGLRSRKEIEGTLRALHEAYGDLFVPLGDAVSRMDAETAMSLIDDPGRLFALGRLLHEEAEFMNMKAAPLDAMELEARARTLVEEALRREPALAELHETRDLIWFTPFAEHPSKRRAPSAERRVPGAEHPADRKPPPDALSP